MPELLVARIWQLLKERRRQFSCCCPSDSTLPPRFGADRWLIHNVVREHLHDPTDIVVIPDGHKAAHKRFAIKVDHAAPMASRRCERLSIAALNQDQIELRVLAAKLDKGRILRVTMPAPRQVHRGELQDGESSCRRWRAFEHFPGTVGA